MYTTIKLLGKHVIQTNPSKFDDSLFSDIIIFVQITFETRKRNTGFCFQAETDRQRQKIRQTDRESHTKRRCVS